MFAIFSVLILIVCALLVLVVLVQNSKGGGLATNFGSSSQVMGVRRTADFLEKATWTLASVLLALSILTSWVIEKPETEVKSRLEQVDTNSDFDQSLPNIPAGLPNEIEEEPAE